MLWGMLDTTLLTDSHLLRCEKKCSKLFSQKKNKRKQEKRKEKKRKRRERERERERERHKDETSTNYHLQKVR